MAPPNGQPSAPLIEQMLDEPHRFDFFQAVRILQRWAAERAGRLPDQARDPIGEDHVPDREAVRFRAQPSLAFPAAPIHRIDPPLDFETQPAEMIVTFLGLTGPSGVLPPHYTRMLIQRIREKDHSLRDYLDLINHRAVSLFYRAWEKYHVSAAVEKSLLSKEKEDVFTRCLFGLSGMGTDHLRDRRNLPDEVFIYYGGLFAHQPRSAIALETMLADYFGLPVEVRQLEGQWLTLAKADRLRLPGTFGEMGCNNRLGVDSVVGERSWDVQSKFRLRVGPLTEEQFRRLLPSGVALRDLAELARSFVGPDLDFDVQLVLQGKEVPQCLLTGRDDGPKSSRLGWNTWLRSLPDERETDDAVFFLDDL